MNTEEMLDRIYDPFYQLEILQRVEDALKRECEIEDIFMEPTYWFGISELKYAKIKIRCKGETESDDMILIATYAEIFFIGNEIKDVEIYPIDNVISKLLNNCRYAFEGDRWARTCENT